MAPQQPWQTIRGKKEQEHIVVLSSMHDDSAFEAGAPKKKPEMVLFYNSTKGAVDSLDKMAHVCTLQKSSTVAFGHVCQCS